MQKGRPVATDRIINHPFTYVLVTFLAFRLMAVWLARPGGYLTTLSDFTFYRYLASYASQGFYPSVHYWMEYQPIFPWIPVGVYRLSLLLPNWGEPGFWFNILMGTFFALSETAHAEKAELSRFIPNRRTEGSGVPHFEGLLPESKSELHQKVEVRVRYLVVIREEPLW